MRLCTRVAAMTLIGASCTMPEAGALPEGSFAFAVFGDGPYRAWEMGPFRHMIRDVNRTDLQWFLHVGDILWYPCSDREFGKRLDAMNSIRHPVIYSPGDNEWADCHERIAGGYRPLERLDRLRSTFFATPGSSLGGRIMQVEPQSRDSTFSGIVENVRWVFGGFVFATLHMVGSGNASRAFDGRTPADDEARDRRTAAALAWMDAAFDLASADELSGVVLAMHGDPGFGLSAPEPAYREFVDRLRTHVTAFGGSVLLIHGDSHELRIDHPLPDPVTGDTLAGFTRLETFGSPDIGWVRVVIDSLAGSIVAFEPRRIPRWWLR